MCEHVFVSDPPPRRSPRSCTPTSTRSSRRSSSATTRASAADRSSWVAAWSWPRATRPGPSACAARWAGGRPASCARTRSSSRRACRRTPRRAGRCSRSSGRRPRSSRGSRSTRPSSTSAGCVGCRARPRTIAAQLRRAVLERVGLRITVGGARTKFLAKVASRVAKPDGLLIVPPAHELEFLHALPVDRLWGVGPATAAQAPRAGHHHRGRGRRARRGHAGGDARPGVGPPPALARATTATRGRCNPDAGDDRWVRSAPWAVADVPRSEIAAMLDELLDGVARRLRSARVVGAHRRAPAALRRLHPDHDARRRSRSPPPTPSPATRAAPPPRRRPPDDRRARAHPGRYRRRQPHRRRRGAAPTPVRRWRGRRHRPRARRRARPVRRRVDRSCRAARPSPGVVDARAPYGEPGDGPRLAR